MMILYCERCHEPRTFLPVEEQPPFDENMACCEVCGFHFGYRQVERVEIVGNRNRITVVTRPVLEPQVVQAGRMEFARRRTAAIRSSGRLPEVVRERAKFEANYGDLDERRKMLGHQGSPLDPGLAQKVLRPLVPGNRSDS
jgi:hypothetical protein